MMRPILARGRTLEGSLSQAAAATANEFHVDDAADYIAGDLVFVGTGADVEFAGHVRSAGASSLTTTLHLRASKSEGSPVWKAAEAFVLPSAPEASPRRDYSTGIATERSPGGQVFSTRVAEPGRTDRLKFESVALRDAQALRAWVMSHLQGGLLDFTYVDERGDVSRARLISPLIVMERPDELNASVELEIAVIAEGEAV